MKIKPQKQAQPIVVGAPIAQLRESVWWPAKRASDTLGFVRTGVIESTEHTMVLVRWETGATTILSLYDLTQFDSRYCWFHTGSNYTSVARWSKQEADSNG